MANENISYVVAFTAGFLTFLSPCLLPIIPSFIAYITGISFGDMTDAGKRAEVKRKAVVHSLLFISGFSLVFILLGLTATFIGKALFNYQKLIRIAGGAFIVLFGLYLMGILRLDFLGKEIKIGFKSKGASYIGSFLIGVTFAAAWTPCAGPILGSILLLAGTKTSIAEGAKLLTAYSLGIAVPFFVTALLVNTFIAYFNKLKKFMSVVNIVSGVFLVIVGILIMTNYLGIIAARLEAAFTK
ncbi:MAG: cytochrome c biogenesis protein CcdA [Candidatus Omnitrophica bacterium]|nr:cytochrome c biogenesis protein CcdA [Candidatus Omnitrophota bacterium]MDD5437341.1 cytochrome c biogenesis protein CcdA [Candidatus Omnitrophota bacterium]